MQSSTGVSSFRTLTARCVVLRLRSGVRPDKVQVSDTVGIKPVGSRHVVCASSETTGVGLKDASAPVTDRVVTIFKKEELDAALDRAGDRLVVLELMRETVCETGLFEVSENQWTTPNEEYEAKMQECMGIRSVFMDMAATSLSARFYCVLQTSNSISVSGAAAVQEDEDAPSDIGPALGITTFPAVVFFKNKKVVWMKQGSANMKGDLAEGVLALGGKQYVTNATVAELANEAHFDAFVKARTANEQHLKVIMMSSYMCSPCVHAYPYFVALSASFKDFEFARLEGDDEAMAPVFSRLNILEVPTILVYNKDGVEVSRLVSSDPGDLVGFIIDLSAKMGFKLPSKVRR